MSNDSLVISNDSSCKNASILNSGTMFRAPCYVEACQIRCYRQVSCYQQNEAKGSSILMKHFKKNIVNKQQYMPYAPETLNTYTAY